MDDFNNRESHLQNVGLDLEIEDRTAEGRYANLAVISHSSSEFIVDFAAHLPGLAKAKVHSRIILTPEHAKRLLYSLQENIARYESNNGRINIPQESQQTAEMISGKIGEA
ncbi:MAG: DUF3467 domain-containing protein [Rikenellaceae bacterium]